MANKNTIPENYNVAAHVPRIVESINFAQTYYLFRTDGTEIKFTTNWKGEILSYKHTLNSTEIAYIRKNILNDPKN